MITGTMLIKWFFRVLFGGVAIVDILLVVACGKMERRRGRKGKN